MKQHISKHVVSWLYLVYSEVRLLHRIGIRGVTQGVAVLHLLLAMYLLVVVLIWNVLYPKLHTPDALTIGEMIVLYTYIPQMILYLAAGGGLLVERRTGWYLALFVHLATFIFQCMKLAGLVWGPQSQHLMIEASQYLDLVFSFLISLGGLIFIMHPRVRNFMQPSTKMIFLVVSLCVLYVAGHQVLYELIFAG